MRSARRRYAYWASVALLIVTSATVLVFGRQYFGEFRGVYDDSVNGIDKARSFISVLGQPAVLIWLLLGIGLFVVSTVFVGEIHRRSRSLTSGSSKIVKKDKSESAGALHSVS